MRKYEVIENGTLYPYNSFDKNREGLALAYEQAEQVLVDNPDLDSLEIQFVTYDGCDHIVACEVVEEFV